MTDYTSVNNPEGRILLDLLPSGDRFSVEIRSQRPLLASRIFEGKSISQTLRTIPLLFNICGQAQSVAAVRAVENALGRHAHPDVEQKRDILITLEGIREHLWRILIDWPKLLGNNSEAKVFAPLNSTLTALLELANPQGQLTCVPGQQKAQSLVSDSFTGKWKKLKHRALEFLFADGRYHSVNSEIPADSEIGRLLQTLTDKGWQNLGDLALPALPELPFTKLQSLLMDEQCQAFIANPQWQSVCYETGPFSRQLYQPLTQSAIEQHGLGAYPRMVARILELLQMLNTVDAELAGVSLLRPKFPEKQLGISQLEAVRGRLVHCLTLDKDRIEHYRILAPTEWNFHYDGIVSRMLSQLKDQQQPELLHQARFLIQLIDPCVGYKLQFRQPETSTPEHA